MKVYSLPAELKFEPDYLSFDVAAEAARELEHRKAVEAWLRKNGYKGKRTGETLRVPHADSYAQYMFGQGSKCILIHLPYGDGWNSPHVARMTRDDVIEQLDYSAMLDRMFADKRRDA